MTTMSNKRFIVFQGAPTTSQLRSSKDLSYSWSKTIVGSPRTSTQPEPSLHTLGSDSTSLSSSARVVGPAALEPASVSIASERSGSIHNVEETSFFPPATLEEASRRISLLYRDVIFNDDDTEDEEERQRQLETTLLEADVEIDESGWDSFTRSGSFLSPGDHLLLRICLLFVLIRYEPSRTRAQAHKA
jgi:hypothetical protein